MAYSGQTPIYQIPYVFLGDLIDPDEERRRVQILDNQIFGAIRAHSGGHGSIREGDYTCTQNSDGTFRVLLIENKTQGKPAIEAFVNQVYVSSDSTLTWNGLSDNTTYFLYVRLVESTELSSLQYGDVIAESSTSATPPGDGLLVAKAVISGGICTVDSNPPGKQVIPILEDHINDHVNPHGTVWEQTNLIVSGLTVLSGMTVVGNITIQGTLNIHGELCVSGTLHALNAVVDDLDIKSLEVISGLTVAQLTVTSGLELWGVTNVHAAVIVDSGIRLDGRDVSFDGSRLDSHIANTSNPHSVTAAQIGALPLAGGHMTGNITMNSGIAIDGVDPSTLTGLFDGGNADDLHTHNLSGVLPPFEIFSHSPQYGDTLESGIPAQVLFNKIRTEGRNAYEILHNATGKAGCLVTRRYLPGDFASWNNITLHLRTDTDATVATGVIVQVYDKNDTLVHDQQFAPPSTWSTQVITVSGGQFLSGELMTAMVIARLESGIPVLIGDTVYKYVPGF